MAVIKGGILGKTSGKIAGVVAATWKNKNYIRTLVTPANPRTTAQVAARATFGSVTSFFSGIVGGILNPYMSPFLRAMSGFNWAVKTNRSSFVGTINYGQVLTTHGQLFPATFSGSTCAAGVVSLTLSTSLGSNGLATDLTYACVYNESSKAWFFPGAEVARSVGTLTINVTGNMSDELWFWVTTVRRDATGRVMMVSDSQAGLTTYA